MILSDEDVVEQLLGDEAVGSRGAELGPPVESRVDGVQLLAQVAAHVEPPVTDEDGLRELRAVGAEERRLAAVDVAVVPALAARVHVREEAGVRLVLAVEVRVGNHGQHGIVGTRSSCNTSFHVIIVMQLSLLRTPCPSMFALTQYCYAHESPFNLALSAHCCNNPVSPLCFSQVNLNTHTQTSRKINI